jgi:hypothetical protein
MKSAIIYSAQTPITPMHRILQPTERFGDMITPREDTELWVRMQLVNADALHALDRAHPMPGETVLNSVELP